MPPVQRRELRQERARATRDAIVQAAACEFDRHGYAAASLSAILARSGVTKGAFYFHFPSKDALALAIVRDQASKWREIADQPDGGQDPLTRLLALSDVALSLFLSSAEVRAALRLSYERPIVQAVPVPVPVWESIVAAQLTAARAQGLLRATVEPADAAQLVNAAMLGARTTSEAVSGTAADLVERVDQMWRLLLPAMATERWLEGWRSSTWERRRRPGTGRA
ncbi:MAG: ScbR family autoregulator-binding transcription factor [Pseudonocardiaceae bacterium]